MCFRKPVMFALIYHEDYNKYDLGVDHPLIGNKPRKTMDFFKEKGLLDTIDVFTPKKATEKDLLRVHEKQYVDHVKQLSKTGGWLASDTPAPVGIYEYARLAAGGTILAGEKLFDGYKCTVNPLGGFHHASKGHSSGFCFFNDIAVVIEYLREKKKLNRFAIIDLDVHHGNGTQDIYVADPTVLNISFHQDGRTLYPGTGALEMIGRDDGEGYTVNLPLPPGTATGSYVMAFDELVPPLIEQFKPEVIMYQCGVDTHHSDPLANLKLTYQAYYHLAVKVHEISRKTCDKLLVLFGGGYQSDACVKSYYNVMCGLLGKKEYFKEEEIPDLEIDIYKDPYGSQIDDIVYELKQKLKPYWQL